MLAHSCTAFRDSFEGWNGRRSTFMQLLAGSIAAGQSFAAAIRFYVATEDSAYMARPSRRPATPLDVCAKDLDPEARKSTSRALGEEHFAIVLRVRRLEPADPAVRAKIPRR